MLKIYDNNLYKLICTFCSRFSWTTHKPGSPLGQSGASVLSGVFLLQKFARFCYWLIDWFVYYMPTYGDSYIRWNIEIFIKKNICIYKFRNIYILFFLNKKSQNMANLSDQWNKPNDLMQRMISPTVIFVIN